jgi:Na+/proline symporter
MVKDQSEKHYLMISRIATVIVALLGVYVASQQQGILDTIKLAAKIGAGYGVLKILRWFWWRVNTWSELTGILVGLIGAITMTTIKKMGLVTPAAWIIEKLNLSSGNFPSKDLYFAVDFIVISLITIILSFAVMYLTKPDKEEVLVKFYSHVKPSGPGWKKIAKLCPQIKITDKLSRDFVGAGIGLIFSFSGVFGAGYLFTGTWTASAISFSLFIISGILLNKVILKNLSKEH